MFPFPLAAHDGFKRLSVPFACLRYGNPWNLILLFSLQGILFINIAQAFILHQSICFDYSSRIACYKSSRCSLPFLLRSNFKSVGFGSDVLWGCYCIHRRHPVSFVLPNQALFRKGSDLFSFFRFFPFWKSISESWSLTEIRVSRQKSLQTCLIISLLRS